MSGKNEISFYKINSGDPHTAS